MRKGEMLILSSGRGSAASNQYAVYEHLANNARTHGNGKPIVSFKKLNLRKAAKKHLEVLVDLQCVSIEGDTVKLLKSFDEVRNCIGLPKEEGGSTSSTEKITHRAKGRGRAGDSVEHHAGSSSLSSEGAITKKGNEKKEHQVPLDTHGIGYVTEEALKTAANSSGDMGTSSRYRVFCVICEMADCYGLGHKRTFDREILETHFDLESTCIIETFEGLAEMRTSRREGEEIIFGLLPYGREAGDPISGLVFYAWSTRVRENVQWLFESGKGPFRFERMWSRAYKKRKDVLRAKNAHPARAHEPREQKGSKTLSPLLRPSRTETAQSAGTLNKTDVRGGARRGNGQEKGSGPMSMADQLAKIKKEVPFASDVPDKSVESVEDNSTWFDKAHHKPLITSNFAGDEVGDTRVHEQENSSTSSGHTSAKKEAVVPLVASRVPMENDTRKEAEGNTEVHVGDTIDIFFSSAKPTLQNGIAVEVIPHVNVRMRLIVSVPVRGGGDATSLRQMTAFVLWPDVGELLAGGALYQDNEGNFLWGRMAFEHVDLFPAEVRKK